MNRKNQTIHVLGPERHAGWACVSPTSALANLIDENRQRVMAYIKPFPRNRRGCFGEISRWTLATAQGISTSPNVWIHLLSPERAREAWPEQTWPDEPTICFASAAIDSDIADCQFQTDSPLFIEMLLKWPMLYHIIALDIWLDNIDSHPGNLIWTGENDFVVIDGAECFSGQFWMVAQLENPAYSINKLAALIGAIDDFAPTANAKMKILAASNLHNAALISCEHLLQEWARKLIGPQECLHRLILYSAALAWPTHDGIPMPYNPLIELTALAEALPPLPRQVNAKVYAIFLNGVRQVRGEAGAIGALFDFPAPINKTVCRTLPITHLLDAFSARQVAAWETQIAIFEERAKSQALARGKDGTLQSSSPETLVLDGPWHANHDTPEELIELQMQIRTGFHKTLFKPLSRGGAEANTPLYAPLATLLKQRFGMVKMIESEEHWQVWQGKARNRLSASSILSTAIPPKSYKQPFALRKSATPTKNHYLWCATMPMPCSIISGSWSG